MKNIVLATFVAALALTVATPSFARNKKVDFIAKTCDLVVLNSVKCFEIK